MKAMKNLLDQFSLSPYEFALLEFTNDPIEIDWLIAEAISLKKVESQPSRPIIFSSKESYFWATTVTYLLSNNQKITSEDIIESYRSACGFVGGQLHRYYSGLLDSNIERAISLDIPRIIINKFISTLDHTDDFYKVIVEKSNDAFEKLINKELIVDPISIPLAGGILALVLIGFFPFSFTKTTEKGRETHRKITALLWDYEKKEMKKGIEIQNINLKLYKLFKALRAFKQALIEETEKAAENGEKIDKPIEM